jgi:hypothetical protein
MTWCNATIRLSCLAIICGLSGCGDSAEESTGDEKTTKSGKQAISIANKADPAKVAPTKLSPKTPVPAEGGKMDIYAPLAWDWVPRSKEHLARFRSGRINAITVHNSEPYTALKDVTKENQDQFVSQIQAALDKELENHKFLVFKVAPITLDGIAPEGEQPDGRPFIGAHYVRRVAMKRPDGKSVKVDLLFLVTVVGGRKYSVELRAQAETVHQTRPAAHAVAAGLKFYDTPKIPSAGAKKTAGFDDSSKESDGKARFDDSAKPAP